MVESASNDNDSSGKKVGIERDLIASDKRTQENEAFWG